jgi:hypothetical protein
MYENFLPDGILKKSYVFLLPFQRGLTLTAYYQQLGISCFLVTPKLCTLQDEGNITYYQHGISCFYYATILVL